MSYRVTVRAEAKVRHLQAASLDEALASVERHARELAGRPTRQTVDLRMKRFEPVAQVASRVELKGSGARGGIDVRGDGSVEAWTGGWRRRVIEPEKGESAYAALRRALGAGKVSAGP